MLLLQLLLVPITREASYSPMSYGPPADAPHYGPERRRHPRSTVQVPIDLLREGSDAVLSTETTDLSRNGCYVRLPEPLTAGERIHATLWLGRVPIEVDGRVVTRHPDFGNGLMFLHIQDPGERELAAYLEAVIAE